MLVSFSVSNFRSFGVEETLNLVASKKLQEHPGHCVPIPGTSNELLRSAVIYGANAAGKSNLIKAMKAAQNAILGFDQPYQPFRFDLRLHDEPSSFEFRFLVDDRVFIYGFDANRFGIESEWLSVLSKTTEVEVFLRNEGGETTLANKNSFHKLFPDDTTLPETLEKLKSLPLNKSQLFLNRARGIPEKSQGKVLGRIIRWLTRDLVIYGASPRTLDILDRLQDDDSFRRFSELFLRIMGTGVTDLSVDRGERPATDWDKQFIGRRPIGGMYLIPQGNFHTDARIPSDDTNRVITRTLLAAHKHASAAESTLPFSEESDGTQQLLHLMPVICPSSEQGKVFVIDELDKSLHPLICREFISFFSESDPGALKQLVVTTHEVNLLDQELLRRDEYWFVEKDKNLQSRLISLADFKIRNDLQIEKGYLNGRFGAIPVIGDMNSLLNLLKCGSEKEAEDATEATAP